MPGPAPKDPSVRARANKAATRATLSASPGVSTPDLPEREWHPMTLSWWADVWSSPMASEYVTADHHGLFRLAVLIDSFWNNPTKGISEEIRLQEQKFGLSPLDRRRLEWTIESAEESKDRGRSRRERGAQQPMRGDDPRSALTIVS